MKNAALSGKSYAGNPHVRFDEGEVASYPVGRPEGVAMRGAKPRRGSLLYKSREMISVFVTVSGIVGAQLVNGADVSPLVNANANKSTSVVIDSAGRLAFVRGEKDARIILSLYNSSTTDWTAAELLTPFGKKTLGAISARQEKTADFAVETRYKPSSRPFTAKATVWTADGRVIVGEREFALLIGPRQTLGTMPIDITDASKEKWVLAKSMGFTKVGNGYSEFEVRGFRQTIADGGECRALVRKNRDRLDHAVYMGLRTGAVSWSVFLPPNYDDRFSRRTRDGKLIAGNVHSPKVIEFGHPEALAYAEAVSRQGANCFAMHPGLDSFYPSSEVRDKAQPSFNTEHIRYKAETGHDVPKDVEKRTYDYKKTKKLYPDGVVPDDDPILSYYRWYWKGGDGMSSYLNAQIRPWREFCKREERVYSTWAPAVRCPPIWWGLASDVLRQWVYAVPDAMNVGGPTEELFAMAESCPGQKVFAQTQIIVYRHSAAPIEEQNVEPVPAWLEKYPNLQFVSIPPDTLQEAAWTMLAKPVSGCSFYGIGCLEAPEEGVYEEKRGYKPTNPETATMMRNLNWNVLRPLGPAMLKIGRDKPTVAVLESFTTCAMGGQHCWGWCAPCVSLLQRARLDPRVIYEESILRGGLRDVKVLYAPSCEFLTPSIIAKIKEFQSNGGVLVADEKLTPALHADINLPVVMLPKVAKIDLPKEVGDALGHSLGTTKEQRRTIEDKRAKLEMCSRLREGLVGKYEPKLDSDNPEIVTYLRGWKNVNYAVVINDKRTFGNYIGQWGLVQEKGLPNEGKVMLMDEKSSVKHVYELSRGGEMAFVRERDRIVLPVRFNTNDGRIFAFLSQKIEKVEVSSSEIRPGEEFEVLVRVVDENDEPIHAVLPLELHVYDAAGDELDGAGFIAAEDGIAKVRMLANLDDAKGGYRLVAKDRASGIVVEKK